MNLQSREQVKLLNFLDKIMRKIKKSTHLSETNTITSNRGIETPENYQFLGPTLSVFKGRFNLVSLHKVRNQYYAEFEKNRYR